MPVAVAARPPAVFRRVAVIVIVVVLAATVAVMGVFHREAISLAPTAQMARLTAAAGVAAALQTVPMAVPAAMAVLGLSLSVGQVLNRLQAPQQALHHITRVLAVIRFTHSQAQGA
jgi:uncharacterized membrane protein YoaK (UPF0700 family)